MKPTTFKLLILSTVSILARSAYCENDNEIVDKYYKQFNVKVIDGVGIQVAYFNFIGSVPVAHQSDTLGTMIERAAKNPKDDQVIVNVITFLANYPQAEPGFTWSSRLNDLLYAQTKNPSFSVRSALVDFLAAKQPKETRDICLSFLNDTDDRVRRHAISAILFWPDSGVIYKNYIATHDSESAYNESLITAKKYLTEKQRLLNGK